MVAIIVINEGLLNSINSNTYYDYDLSVTTVNHHRSEDTTIRFGLTRSPASSQVHSQGYTTLWYSSWFVIPF